jgi:hypothetical protein
VSGEVEDEALKTHTSSYCILVMCYLPSIECKIKPNFLVLIIQADNNKTGQYVGKHAHGICSGLISIETDYAMAGYANIHRYY